MKPRNITTVLLAGALLSACGGGDKDGGGVGAGPAPNPQPSSTEFNLYVRSIFASGPLETLDPLPVETLSFTFNDNDETAFDPLIP